MLSPYRVLDLTDQRGEIAGMILGDLGADVIVVEPPGGSPGRRQGVRLGHGPESERSLQFFAYNRNKRSIVLDLAQDDDRDTFLGLVAAADFVLESCPPGELARHGIDFEALRRKNPRIVHVQLSPFGADGPAAGRSASDLTISALGGQAALQGTPDRAPVRVTAPQIWRHAGAEGAVAALVGHARMRATGEAQLVDLSAQCATTWTTMNAMNAHAIQGFEFERMGSAVQVGVSTLEPVFACADGHLTALDTGNVLGPLLDRLIADGVVDVAWRDEDWTSYDLRTLAGQETSITREQLRDALGRFFVLHKKRELFEWGVAAGVTLAPVNTVTDLDSFAQLEAREAWATVRLADGQSVRLPGVFARATRTPLTIRRPAPSLDEHGDEIRAELEAGARSPLPAEPATGAGMPLEGIKVVALTWIIAGPASVRYFADHGATVVKIESELRPDGLRGLGPIKGKPGWNTSHFFGDFNAGMHSLQLHLKQPAALEIMKRLVGWADVVLDNWAPGAMERAGLGYDTLRRINPSVIMLSTSLLGQTGPASGIAGFGYHAGAMAGFYEVTGWPDRAPDGPWMAYTDVIAPRFIAATVLAALDHRRRSGEGQYIDAAQLEMALHFLAPEILDAQTSGYVATRLGNRARDAAPQGIYPCEGDDQWCAIAIDTDEQWQALRQVLGDPEWARDAALEHVAGRLTAHDAIDEQLSAWTRTRTPRAAMDPLSAAGVPAGAVQRSADLLRDPQYAHRGFHRHLEHAEIGRVPYAGSQFVMRGYPGGPKRPGPLLGEHNVFVLQELLGLDDDAIADLIATGAVQ